MDFIKDILKGVAIGIANIVPGVSGGTMMVSMGIYDKIIGAVTGIFKHFKDSLKIVLPYVIGMIFGVIGLSFSIEYFFDNFPFQTAMLFIGLIFGGLPLLFPKIKGDMPSLAECIIFLMFFSLIIGIQFLGHGTEKNLTLNMSNIIILFFVGVIAAATMVIPGVSGSMILMSLGYYNPIINCVNLFVKALVTFNFSVIFQSMCFLIPFGIGTALGVFFISKIIEVLMKKHERKTYFAILGLVIASPIAIFMETSLVSITLISCGAGICMFGIGFIVAYMLGK